MDALTLGMFLSPIYSLLLQYEILEKLVTYIQYPVDNTYNKWYGIQMVLPIAWLFTIQNSDLSGI